jgi:ligand-binding sensor domain-containing protein
MCQGSNGLLWISRAILCIVMISKIRRSFLMINEDSIAHGLIYDIVEDDNGDIWITTGQGLWQFLLQDQITTGTD